MQLYKSLCNLRVSIEIKNRQIHALSWVNLLRQFIIGKKVIDKAPNAESCLIWPLERLATLC